MWSRQFKGLKSVICLGKLSKFQFKSFPIQLQSHHQQYHHSLHNHQQGSRLFSHLSLQQHHRYLLSSQNIFKHSQRYFSDKHINLPSPPDLVNWRFRLSFLFGSGAIAWLIWERKGSSKNKPIASEDDEEEEEKLPDPTVMLSEEQVQALLKKEEQSILPDMYAKSNSFISRMDLNSVASNDPIEDTHSEYATDKGVIVGIFDGHSGTQCSSLVSTYLSSYISRELKKINHLPPGSQRQEQVKLALQQAFISFDSDLLSGVFAKSQRTSSFLSSWITGRGPSYDYYQVIQDLKGPLSGSCAIVAYIEGKDVYVACTGDSRAVMGQKTSFKTADGKETNIFIPHRLSEDQTAKNPHEYARMIEEHPGEESTVITRGRVLGGLMPTRAFGDARYKWSLETLNQVREHVYPHRRQVTRSNYLSPPYVTAKPEVVHYERTDRDSFLILATDGIWDELSDEQAVKAVGKITSLNVSGHETPSSVEPANAATALIKAALGGDSNPDRMRKLLSLRAPISRRYRDDMTVNVVLFDETHGRFASSKPSRVLPTVDPTLPASRTPKLDELLSFLNSRKSSIPSSKL